MAHVRRKFYDLVVAHKSPVGTEAVERIGALYAIEKEIRGRGAGGATGDPESSEPTGAELIQNLAGRNLGQALAKIGYGRCGSLCSGAMESVGALL
jgi:Transposase IS66 family